MEKDAVLFSRCFTKDKSHSSQFILNLEQRDNPSSQHNEQPSRNNANYFKDPISQSQQPLKSNENLMEVQISGPRVNLEDIKDLKDIEKIIYEKGKSLQVGTSDQIRHFSDFRNNITSYQIKIKSIQLNQKMKLSQQFETFYQEKLIRYRIQAINKEIKFVFNEIVAFNMSKKMDKVLERLQEMNYKKKISQLGGQKAKTQEFLQNENKRVFKQQRQSLKNQRRRQQQQKKEFLMRRIDQLQKQLRQQENKLYNLFRNARRASLRPSQEIIMEENECLEDENIQKVKQ